MLLEHKRVDNRKRVRRGLTRRRGSSHGEERLSRPRVSPLTINFEIFDLRSVSRAFQLYACEQWPPTPGHYIYSPVHPVRVRAYKRPPLSSLSLSLPLDAYMYTQRRVRARRVHSLACIYLLHFLSAAINFRSTFHAQRAANLQRGRRRQPHQAFARHESSPSDHRDIPVSVCWRSIARKKLQVEAPRARVKGGEYPDRPFRDHHVITLEFADIHIDSTE